MSSAFHSDATRVTSPVRPGRGERGFVDALLSDGRPAILLLATCLALSGGFAIVQSLSGYFLPHDVDFLGRSAADLCGVAGCRVVGFMFHDRVAFGGALVATGTIYAWLTLFPLRRGERWALRTLSISAGAGFVSFLAFLGYGYLDAWHAVATLLLLPVFLVGVALLRRRAIVASAPLGLARAPYRAALGRLLLLGTSAGLAVGGATVLAVGATVVFVPQDIAYIGLDHARLHEVSSRLVPLIAHDRAGFGGALLAAGLALTGVLWWSPVDRSLWEALVLVGVAGFGSAIGVHAAVGYHDLTHVGPAMVAAVAYAVGLLLTAPPRAARA